MKPPLWSRGLQFSHKKVNWNEAVGQINIREIRFTRFQRFSSGSVKVKELRLALRDSQPTVL